MNVVKLTPDLTNAKLNAKSLLDGRLYYNSQGLLAKDRNIDIRILQCAKRKRAPGFAVNGKIFWDELAPYLVANYQLLHAEVEEENSGTSKDYDYWELQEKIEKVKKLRHENKLNGDTYISKKEVINTIKPLFALLFSEIERTLCHDLISKYQLIIKDINKADEEKLNALRELNVKQVESLLRNLKNEKLI